MKRIMTKDQVQGLINFVDIRLEKVPCDHSLRFSNQWAKDHGIDLDDFVDILDECGAFCDCEVLYNLPEDQDILLDDRVGEVDDTNPWKVPQTFSLSDPEKVYSNVLVSVHSEKNKWYAEEGELLIPAQKGAKPKKRVRKSVHFFVGIETGLPNEVGFVKTHSPVTAREFAKQVRESKQEGLKKFREFEAAFFLSRLEKLKEGDPVGTHFMEVKGIAAMREEVRIHKVFLKK